MKFDIWCEGYSATGEHCPPYLEASDVEGDNFQDACIRWRARRERQVEAQGHDPDSFLGRFDPDELTVWGCRLAPILADLGLS